MNHPASVLSRFAALRGLAAIGLALGLSTLVTLTGCASDQAPSSAATGGDRSTSTAMQAPRTRWSTDLATPASIDLADADVLGDLVVIVEEPTNIVTGLELTDGATRFRTALPFKGQAVFKPLRVGNQLILSSTTRMAVVDANNGALRRVFEIPALIETAPALGDGTVVAASPTGLVFAMDPTSGIDAWQYQMPAGVSVSPAVGDTLVLAGDSKGNYSAFFSNNGEVVWRGRTFGRISAQPIGSSSTFFVPSQDHALYALARATGSDRWVYRTTEPMTASPLLAQGKVLQPAEGDKLLALDARNGDVIWQRDRFSKPITALADSVVVRENGQLVMVSLADGTTVQTLPYRHTDAVLAAPEDTLIIVQRGGRVLRVEP